MIAENHDSKYIVTQDAYVKINKSKFCKEMLNSKKEGELPSILCICPYTRKEVESEFRFAQVRFTCYYR